MEKLDYLSLDGNQLRLLLIIKRAGSLSSAAKILDLNQSTVSYQLEQLRKRLGDPLFVRSGNGVEPTEHANTIIPLAQQALLQLEAIGNTQNYDPHTDNGTFRIAASQIERDRIFAPFIKDVLKLAPQLTIDIEFIGSPFQASERLRNGDIDALLVPNTYFDGGAFMQTSTFSFRNSVFFDPSYPLRKGDFDAYCKRPHIRIAFGPQSGFFIDRAISKLGRTRHIALQVGDFDSAFSLIKDTPLIVTLPDLMGSRYPHLSKIPPPYESQDMQLMLYWHERHQKSTRHKFWREKLVHYH